MILCLVVGDGEGFFGYGCSSNVRIAVTRAISEALQSMATIFSGAREGMIFDDNYKKKSAEEHAKVLPHYKTLRIQDFRKRVHDRSFKDLRNELSFLLKWLHHAGFPNALTANLTRRGLDIPVVRAVVPRTLPVPEIVGLPFNWTSGASLKERYGI
jgi:ribosomal protein S12 methylthiotransferase accessory factor